MGQPVLRHAVQGHCAVSCCAYTHLGSTIDEDLRNAQAACMAPGPHLAVELRAQISPDCCAHDGCTAVSLGRLAACPVAEAQLPGHVQGPKGAKAFEKAEDPIYALEHNLPIDAQHYLDHHLEQPLMRIFEPIMRNPKDLLHGAPAGGLSAAVRPGVCPAKQCLGC